MATWPSRRARAARSPAFPGRAEFLALQAREGGAEAEVDALAEGDVPVLGAAEVQAVRLGELRRVPVRGSEAHRHGPSRRDAAAADLHVLQGNAAGPLDGAVEAQELLHGALDQAGLAAE